MEEEEAIILKPEWNVTSFTEKEIEIQLILEDPLNISKYLDRDIVQVQVLNPHLL